MFQNHPSKTGRITAGILCILMLLLMLVSSFYIAKEANHHCIGEQCPVCLSIHQCQNTLHQLSGGILRQIALILPVLLILFIPVSYNCDLNRETLVSKKIRLNY